MTEKRLNIFPFLRDLLIVVGMVPLFLCVLGVAPHFLMGISFLLLGMCYGLSIYLLLMVKLWSLNMLGKIGAAILAATLIVAAFIFGLMNVFYKSLPDASSVMPRAELFWSFFWLGILALIAMVTLTVVTALNRIDLVCEPVRTKKYEWWIIACGSAFLVTLSYLVRF